MRESVLARGMLFLAAAFAISLLMAMVMVLFVVAVVAVAGGAESKVDDTVLESQ